MKGTGQPAEWWKRTLMQRLVLLSIVIAYVAARLLDLDRVVTTDEPFWLGRSGNFYRALVTGELEHTYQMAHPGVMTMWSGALAYLIALPEYAQLAAGNMNVPYGIEKHLREMGQDPLQLMMLAKTIKVTVQAIFFAIAMLALPRLIGPETTIVTAILITFSPMMSGFDSALHVDGMFSTICLAAIVLICRAGFASPPPTVTA